MPYLSTADGDLYFEDSGQGTPLIMLRGLGRSIKHWHGFDAKMAQHFRVITMDARGIGKTKRLARYTDTLFDLADDLVLLLDHLGEKNAHIMGVSLGGMIALALALRHPERCRSLIVVNTSIAGQSTLRLSLGAKKVLLQGATYRRAEIHDLLADILTGQTYASASKEDLATSYKRIAAEEGLPQATVLRQLLGAARFRVRSKLAKMQVPTLIMYGSADRFVPVENSKKLFRLLPHAKLAGVEGGGHELTVDRPDEVEGLIIDWIKDHP